MEKRWKAFKRRFQKTLKAFICETKEKRIKPEEEIKKKNEEIEKSANEGTDDQKYTQLKKWSDPIWKNASH